MKEESIKFTVYLPLEMNEQIEFLRFKTRKKKNEYILEALKEYLPKQLKKYPEAKEMLNEK